MTAIWADPIRYVIFGVMNTDKANNTFRADRKERAVVAGLQLKNAASDVLDLAKTKTGKIAGKLKTVSEGIHSARCASKVFDGLCKGVNFFAEKLINPILIGAGIVRVASADDKKSASIKEGGALTFMLAGEWGYKHLFGLGGKTAKYTQIKPLDMVAKGLKTFAKNNKVLSKLPLGKFTGLVKALGFIATSCSMFSLGEKAGQALADRTTAKQYALEHPTVGYDGAHIFNVG